LILSNRNDKRPVISTDRSFRFCGKEVNIRYTGKTIEVFFHNNRIASHIRRYGVCAPVVLPEHMPENHRQYLAWNSETFLEWASGIGRSTETVMKILSTMLTGN
jgi:hypothetical protein